MYLDITIYIQKISPTLRKVELASHTHDNRYEIATTTSNERPTSGQSPTLNMLNSHSMTI